MLRRFEMYGFRPETTPDQVAELARVLRDSGRFIPELLDSAVGTNRSEADLGLVWEHSYESPADYDRYMRHPFHICVLDRYLLPEGPECITAPRRELGMGLLGYEVVGAPFRSRRGVRRVVVLKFDPDAEPGAVDTFVAGLARRAETEPDVRLSVVAVNSMGLEWWPDAWTHVWEQVFDDEAAMQRSLPGEAALLDAGPVASRAAVYYEIEGAEERV